MNRFWKEALCIVLIALAGYLPTLWHGFIYDDQLDVVSNPLAHGTLDLHKIFTESSYPPGKQTHSLYQPLVTLSFHLDGKVWGFVTPGHWNGFHLTNLLLHALNGCLFILLLRRLELQGWTRFFSGVIFVLHPALSEAVAWISGRAELLGMAFALAAILFLLSQRLRIGLFLFFIFWILSMLCKETYVVLPGLVALLIWLFPKKIFSPQESSSSFSELTLFLYKKEDDPKTSTPKLKLNLKRILFLGILCLAIVAALWSFRFTILGNWTPRFATYQHLSIFARIVTVLGLLWKYIGLWLCPTFLSIYHDIYPITQWSVGLFFLSTWLFTFWLLWRIRTFFPWCTLAIAWFWISILPVSNLILPMGAIFGERFLYGSTLFFAPASILLLQYLSTLVLKNSWRQPFWAISATVGCVLLFTRLWLRLDCWKSNTALWESASKCYPESFAIRPPWSEAFLREGKFAEAHLLASQTLKQLEQKPKSYQDQFVPILISIDAAAQSGMQQLSWIRKFLNANEAARNMHYREALEAYQQIIQEFPDQPQTYEALGDLYIRLKNPIAALQNFKEALDLGAKNPVLYGKYAKVLSELDRKAEALMAYDRALEINPRDPLAFLTHYNRGVVLGELGDYSNALSAFQTASDLAPPKFVAPHLNSASIFIHLKRYEEARKEIQKVLAQEPQQSETHELLQKIVERK